MNFTVQCGYAGRARRAANIGSWQQAAHPADSAGRMWSLLLITAFTAAQTALSALVEPAWDMDMLSLTKQYCIQPANNSLAAARSPSSSSSHHRRMQFPPPPPLLPGPRLAWVAQPAGKAPVAGWPLYFQFVTDGYPSSNDGAQCTPPNTGRAGHKSYQAFDTPKTTLAPCVQKFNGSTDDYNCSFDQLSGALWDQRIKQGLLSNGIAVLQLNPAESDSWDAGPASASGDFQGWPSGPDHATFESIFAMLKAGTMGHFDLSKLIFHGWSSGAQMVSWMAQLEGTGELAKLGGGAGGQMAGGVYISGGSYTCYPDKGWQGGGVCATCNASTECAGGGWFQNAGCSTCRTNCGDFNRTGPPCCSKCCPDNYTEAYYDSEAKYKRHPPAFLAQAVRLCLHI